jgi:hypothetical protein
MQAQQSSLQKETKQTQVEGNNSKGTGRSDSLTYNTISREGWGGPTTTSGKSKKNKIHKLPLK